MVKNVKRKLSLKKVTVAALGHPTLIMLVTDEDSVLATTVTGPQTILSSDRPTCRFYTQK